MIVFDSRRELYYFFQRPNMIRQSCGHRRGDSERFVNSGEIVILGMDRNHSNVIFDLL